MIGEKVREGELIVEFIFGIAKKRCGEIKDESYGLHGREFPDEDDRAPFCREFIMHTREGMALQPFA